MAEISPAVYGAAALAALMAAFHAEPHRELVVKEYAARIGKSKSRFYALYYRWREKGIKGLTARPTGRPRDRREDLPEHFLEWFKGVFQGVNTDSVPAARRRMLEKLAAGESVPGLGTWQQLWLAAFPDVPLPDAADGHWPRDLDALDELLPKGLSARNLLRHKAELVESLAARQGTFAAARYAPMVMTTRVGLKAGQILICDDVWHNVEINWPGSTRALRPIELCMLDALTAHKVAWGMRPRTWNDQTQRHEIVKEHEFRFLLAYALCEAVGYRKDGTILWLERGTAAVDDELAGILAEYSEGAIAVKTAPLKDARQLCSLYRAVGSGNPQFKARLEAHHNVGHTELSHLVGQVGRHRDLCPEELYGRDRANNLLLQISAVLPEHLAQLLALPFMQWSDYLECVGQAYDGLARRTWHQLEGWEGCGFHAQEVRLAEHAEWIPVSSLLDLAPAAANAILDGVRGRPELCRIRPLSPIEAWARESRDLVKLPAEAMPLILGPKNGVLRACPQEQYLRFTSRELGPMPHVYAREYTDPDGDLRRMIPGTQYLLHINPFSPARDLFLSDARGRFLGTAKRIAVPCQADNAAVLEEIKRKKAEWSRIAARVQGRALGKLAREATDQARNAALVGAAVNAGLLPGRPAPEPAAPTAESVPDADAAILEMSGQS